MTKPADIIAEKNASKRSKLIDDYLKPDDTGGRRETVSKVISTASGAVGTIGGAKGATAAALGSTHLYGGAAVMKGLAVTGALAGGGAATGIVMISLAAATTGFITYSIVRAITRK